MKFGRRTEAFGVSLKTWGLVAISLLVVAAVGVSIAASQALSGPGSEGIEQPPLPEISRSSSSATGSGKTAGEQRGTTSTPKSTESASDAAESDSSESDSATAGPGQQAGTQNLGPFTNPSPAAPPAVEPDPTAAPEPPADPTPDLTPDPGEDPGAGGDTGDPGEGDPDTIDPGHDAGESLDPAGEL